MKKQLLLVAAVLVSAATTFSQNVPSYIPLNGLKAWYPFNGNANDESGNTNNGTVNGSMLTNDRNGFSNSAYSFNGINNFITLPSSVNDLMPSSFSFSLWLNPTSYQPGYEGYEVIDDRDISSYNFRYRILYSVNNPNNGYADSTYFETCNNGSNGCNHIVNIKPKAQNWYHYTITYDNNTNIFKAYSNGALVGIMQNTNVPFTSRQINIGRSVSPLYPSGSSYVNGKIDDIGFWNRALTQQEITNLYLGCKDETATTSSLSNILLTNSTPVTLNANPSGGTFSGAAVANGQFVPSKARLGKNAIKYNFTNSTGCKDSTDFYAIVADTNTCSTYDTLKIKVNITAGVYANQSNTVKIYPNPTNTDLVIDNGNFAMLTGYKVAIFNSVGAKVYEGAINSSETTIPLSSLGNKGIYIVRILDSNNQTIENKTIVLE